jgi:hypothetical protein
MINPISRNVMKPMFPPEAAGGPLNLSGRPVWHVQRTERGLQMHVRLSWVESVTIDYKRRDDTGPASVTLTFQEDRFAGPAIATRPATEDDLLEILERLNTLLREEPDRPDLLLAQTLRDLVMGVIAFG